MQNHFYRLLAWMVLLLGLAGSGAASYWVKLDIDARAYQQFVSYCEEIQLKITARLKAHEQTLLGGVALFDASETVERQEWRAYVKRLRLNQHFNGIQGLGFALWIPAAQLPAHQARIRAEGFPDYNVYPEGEREAYSSIIFLEPFTERNLRAFGYDMYSEPVRQFAMARARDENAVTLSGRVILAQETDKDVQAGTLMYVPVYKKGQPIDTVEQRRAALFGWVYSPFRMTDLLNNIVLPSQETNVTHVHLHVYDGNTTQAEHLLYDNKPNHPDTKTTHQHRLLVELTNNFNGTIWTLQFEQIIGANGLDYRRTWITLSTGVLISWLLFLLSTSYLNMRSNAVKIAAKLTRELQESESRFRILADSAPVLIWIIEPDKRCSHVNKVWRDFTGRTLEQELGDGWAEGVHADDLQRCMDVFISSFDARLPFTTEYRLRRYDGEYRWLLDTGIPRFADDGSFLGYIGSCVDITDNKQAQINIEKSLSLLQATLESSSDAILVVDLNNTWILHNQKFVDLWHIPDEIITSNDDNAALSFVLKQLDDAEGFLNKVFDLYNSPEADSFDTIHFKNGKIIERYSIPQRINRTVVGRVWSFRDVTERKVAEIAIAEAQTLLRSIIDTAPIRVFWKDYNLRYLGCNLAFAKDAGMTSPEDLIGKDDYQMGWRNQAELYRADDRAVLESGIAKLSYDEPQTTPSGEIIWLRTSKVVLKNADNETMGLLGVYEDITERKRVEYALYESQTLLQTAQRAARLGHYVADIHILTAITWTNDPLFDEIYGLDSHFVRNMENWSQIIHPEDRQRVMDDFQQFILRCKQFPSPESIDSIVYRIIRPNDGTECWIEAWAYNFYDDNGNPIQQVGMVQDITERKRMEEKLRENENKLNTILDNVEAYIYIKDDQHRYQYANKLVRALFAQPLEAIIGKTDNDFFDSHTAANLYNNDRRVIEFGERVAIEEINTCKDNTFRNIYLSVKQPLYYDNGSIYGLCGISTDITERKQMEDALKASEEKFRSIINVSPVPLTLNDNQQNIIFLNPAFIKTFGYDLNDIPTLADWWLKAYPDPDYRQWVINTWQARLEQAEREHQTFAPLEITIQCKNNTQRIVLASATMISHTFSDVHLVVLYDITELKQVELARRVSEEQLQAFYELDLVGLTITSPEKGWIRINDCLCKMLGYSEQELHLMSWVELTYPDDLAADVEQFDRLLANEINGYALEKRFVSSTGKIIPTRLVVRCVRKANGEVDYVMAMVEDITEYKKAEAELRIAATVFESQEGMFITDAHEIILNVNKAFTLITGYSAAEVIGQTPRLLYSGRHDKEFYTAIWQSIQNTGAWHGELWNRRKNGEVYPEQLSITAVKGSNDAVTHYVATMTDITERKEMEDYVQHLAFYDALTQLPNRRLLQERLKHGIELNHRTGDQMAVLMMDLDKFKAVNDTLGHAAGDELLQQVAERVKARLREVDMVARLGGDEFVILLENIDQYEHVAHVAQSIIDTLSQPFTLSQDHEVSIGASIGIGICPHHGSSVETLMDNADAALYHAKDSGRGCFAYFSEALTKKAHERLALESRLRCAIEQQELRLYFQPQIEINSGRLVGAEMLVYWNDPDKGNRVMLKDFITLAEETGVAVAIGEWALRETCKLGRQWLDEGLRVVTLAVNISSYQFRCGDIKDFVTQVLDETGFPPDYLGLEITETGLMVNQQHALSILNSLNTRSIQLSIDDFGTGYSSLARLKSFPIDILKIDKTFINNIPFSQDDMTITATIIDMAHHLDFKVLAEGVETPKQLTFLRQQGCDYYQGDLYSKALSAHDFALLLSKS